MEALATTQDKSIQRESNNIADASNFSPTYLIAIQTIRDFFALTKLACKYYGVEHKGTNPNERNTLLNKFKYNLSNPDKHEETIKRVNTLISPIVLLSDQEYLQNN